MPSSYQAQEFLFQRIKEMLPPHISLVDAVAEILHVSTDSSYRRIRGETPLVLDEAKELCDHFHLSLDQLLNVKSGSTLFQDVRINVQHYSYEKYLRDLLAQVEYVNSFVHKEVIYRTKDVPVFHNFYFEPLIAFRYFFWMKTIIQHPDFSNKKFSFDCVSPEIVNLSKELTKAYNNVPSAEIWSTECINAAISQIEFYKDTGNFLSVNDIKTVYKSLEQTFEHLKTQAEYGCKFMPDENPETKKNNFRFFYNRVALGDNTILVTMDRLRTVFLNYEVLNYMTTRDETFCEACYNELQAQMRRSTLISQTGEKQRNIFFGIMFTKIHDRIRNL